MILTIAAYKYEITIIVQYYPLKHSVYGHTYTHSFAYFLTLIDYNTIHRICLATRRKIDPSLLIKAWES